MRSLHDSWRLGGLTIPNRVGLAPLAGIGNWFVRLQAKRFGAGFAISEMVSSHAIHHGNERTCTELLRIHPDERAGGVGGTVSVQLFGGDPDVMRSAAEHVAQVGGVDVIDLNMGCPVPKVCKTGAGAALLDDPDRAVAVARAAREGSGLPVTVKMRPGLKPGQRTGVDLAKRLVEEAGVAGLCMHPRVAKQRHGGRADYDMVRRMVEDLPVPVLISGGLRDAAKVHEAFERTGAEAVLLARGSLGNPWIFEQVLGAREGEPSREEVLAEVDWVLERAVEHLGEARAARYLRKFYPWYVTRLGEGRALQDRLQRTQSTAEARAAFGIAPSFATAA
jgi:tRNA-dihydrouridine synthase B